MSGMVWRKRACFGMLALAVTVGLFVAAAYWLASRPAQPVSQAEIQAHRLRAMAWLKANETRVLADSNVALWWMIKKAADHSGDPYLHQLTQQALATHFTGINARQPWRRMLEPRADVDLFAIGLDELADYQRFFNHAMTCRPVGLADGDTSLFMRQDMCAPMLTKVVWQDPVCTTHQIIGLMLMRQTGCEVDAVSDELFKELLDDVTTQLTWDPVMRDPHIQRLLVLAMSGRIEAIRPIWLRRMLDAQELDGGWLGYRRIPELPAPLSPWYWREWLARLRPSAFALDRKDIDFHATAQGLLLLTLMTPAEAGQLASMEQK